MWPKVASFYPFWKRYLCFQASLCENLRKKKVDKVLGNGSVNHFFTFGMCLACVSTISIVPVPVLLRATRCKNLEKHFLLDFLWVSETSTSTTRTEGVALCILAAYPNWCLPASLSAQMIILVISRGPFICCPFLKTNWSHLETLQTPLRHFRETPMSIRWPHIHSMASQPFLRMASRGQNGSLVRSSNSQLQQIQLPTFLATGKNRCSFSQRCAWWYIIETRRMDTNGRFHPPEIDFNISQAFEPLM